MSTAELFAPAGPEALATLQVADLMEAAAKQEGLDDFGADPFSDGLNRLVGALRAEARLNVMGLGIAQSEIVNLLANRLRTQRDLLAHPEIRDEELIGPLVILGLPRTGTSKLLRLVAADPGMQSAATWRSLNPAPIGPVGPDGEDPRIAIAREGVEMLKAYFPDFIAAHPADACEPDEELYLMALTFASPLPFFQFRVPTYMRWVAGQPSWQPVYEHLRLMLQYLQWQDGGAQGRPWVLKSPLHLGHLEELLAVFPNAVLVHCHRHPRITMPSFGRLIETGRQTRSSDVDPVEIGSDFLPYWSGVVEDTLRFRNAGGASASIDLRYEDIRDSDMAVLEQVYDTAGWAVTPQARAAFAAWSEENPINKHGRHEYSLERFGLTEDSIDEAFRGYIDRYFS